MTIVGDDKDWTWVLHTPCPECGYDAAAHENAQTPDLIRANVAAWEAVLGRPDVGTRPDEATWSPLEYACHVRDVYRLFDVRLDLMRAEDDPLFGNWDQDATAVTSRYGEQDPARVWLELQQAGGWLATRFSTLTDEEWTRPGRRSDGAAFTIDSFGRYLLHDPAHHLWDVRLQDGL